MSLDAQAHIVPAKALVGFEWHALAAARTDDLSPLAAFIAEIADDRGVVSAIAAVHQFEIEVALARRFGVCAVPVQKPNFQLRIVGRAAKFAEESVGAVDREMV